MMHVLVTGGAGYLGSIMVPALLECGYHVTVLDNFMYRQNSLAHVCAHPHFNVAHGDARDESVLKPLIVNADFVVPLAALVGAPLCDMDKMAAETTNLGAVQSLMKLMSPSQGIVMPVTNSGYGVGVSDRFCTEESPLRPITLYGRTKVSAEQEVLDRGNAISFRLATVFGMAPRMRIDLLVNDFVYRALNDRAVVLFEAHFKRNYIHVRDVARAFEHGLKNFNSLKDNAYNVGLSSANLSKAELCAKIKEHLPKFVYLEAPVGEDPDKRNYIVSNDKIERTGFWPTHSLDDGIAELIKGYRTIRNTVYGNV